MSAQDLAVQALAELEAKVDAGLEAVRTRTTEAKTRLESGMLNLRSQTGHSSDHSSNGVSEAGWDLESAAAADAAAVEQLGELAAKPLDLSPFDDGEFDSDEFEGIQESN